MTTRGKQPEQLKGIWVSNALDNIRELERITHAAIVKARSGRYGEETK